MEIFNENNGFKCEWRKLIINLVCIIIQQKEQKTLIGLFKRITKGEHKSIS